MALYKIYYYFVGSFVKAFFLLEEGDSEDVLPALGLEGILVCR